MQDVKSDTTALNTGAKKMRAPLPEKLSKYQIEFDQMPEIFHVRIDALKELNPTEFTNSADLILSSLAATYLIKKLPNGIKDMTKELYLSTHEKYDLDPGGDIRPHLVTFLVACYFDDLQKGAIDKNGKIIDIKHSGVMKVYHNFQEEGVPCDAKNTVARYVNIKTLPNESLSR